MTFGRHWIAAAAVVPLLLLGACSQDDPQPTFSPPSDSPSSTESTPAEPVVRPWEKKTEAGAVAFAKHWIDVFNKAQASGKTGEMRSISAKACGSCDGFASQLEELYGGGGSLVSDGWTVVDASAAKGPPEGRAIVAVRVDRSPQVVRPGGGAPQRYAGGKATYSARLTWASNAWVMDELELLT